MSARKFQLNNEIPLVVKYNYTTNQLTHSSRPLLHVFEQQQECFGSMQWFLLIVNYVQASCCEVFYIGGDAVFSDCRDTAFSYAV